MARTIREIADGMKADFVRSEALRTAFGLTAGYDPDGDAAAQAAYYDQNFSAVSVETCILYVVAACAALVYEKTAKAFQYQDGNGTDYQLDIDTGEYAVTDEEARIVRHASAVSGNGFGVTLKVAKGDTALSPLDTDELAAFTSYINRLKPAGVPVTVISRNADRLAVNMTVYYDPIVFTEATALLKIKETMAAYLKDIDFNGEFVTMEMVDRLQAVAGLDIIEIHEAKAKHEGYPYEEIESNTRYIPVPGYMVLGDDADLEIELKCR